MGGRNMLYSISNMHNFTEQSNKIEVPVPSNISVYAQYKYVRGVPASNNQEPVPLSRAQVIDNMVSYLNNSPDNYQLDRREEFQVDELESEVHRVINERPKNFNSIKGEHLDKGVVFDLRA